MGATALLLLEGGKHLLGRVPTDPCLDRLVQLIGVFEPPCLVDEPRLVDEVGPPDEAHHPHREALGCLPGPNDYAPHAAGWQRAAASRLRPSAGVPRGGGGTDSPSHRPSLA
jgi:hypothetical protein